jgi:hypothetical protein
MHASREYNVVYIIEVVTELAKSHNIYANECMLNSMPLKKQINNYCKWMQLAPPTTKPKPK